MLPPTAITSPNPAATTTVMTGPKAILLGFALAAVGGAAVLFGFEGFLSGEGALRAGYLPVAVMGAFFVPLGGVIALVGALVTVRQGMTRERREQS